MAFHKAVPQNPQGSDLRQASSQGGDCSRARSRVARVAAGLTRRLAPALMAAHALMGGLAAPAGASDVELGGKVGHYLFYGTGQGATLQNEIRYQLSLRARPNWDGQVYLRWTGTAALSPGTSSSPLFERPPSSAWPNLDEAYVDFYFPVVDLRLGRQVVHWGTADGINPSDVINPRSLSLDALIDREVRSLPVPAVRAALEPRPGFGLTAVGVADFVPAPFPTEAVYRVAWAASGGSLAPKWLDLSPAPTGAPWELAVRAEGMVRRYNLYLSYFTGFDDFPALWMQPGASGWQVVGRYRRQQQFGVALAGTVGQAGVWAEAAYTVPERVSELEAGFPVVALSSNAASWQAVTGADYTFSGKLHVSGQLVFNQPGSLLLPYHRPDDPSGLYSATLIRYTGPSSRTWEAMAMVNLRDGSILVVPGVIWELRPGLKLVARYVDVVGGDSTEFGRLRREVRGIATRLELVF